MDKVLVSIVVLTKDEEHNINACLKSVHGWADEILVVDDESTDKTLEIVRKFTDNIVCKKMSNEGEQRNWAYSQVRNDWVLSLDADEVLTAELKEEIKSAISDKKYPAFSIPRRNYIGEYWLKYGGQYPASQIKLFLKDSFRYEEVGVHPRAFVSGDTGKLKGYIIHKSYRDFEHFLTKLNKQTTLEAEKWISIGQNMTRGRVIRRAIDRFFRAYIRKKGFKDGFYGFMFAYFASLYQIVSYAKYREMKQRERKK